MSSQLAASRHRTGKPRPLPTVSRQQLDALRQRVAHNLAARRREAARLVRPVVDYDDDYVEILGLLRRDS
jgi:hypothetical protein